MGRSMHTFCWINRKESRGNCDSLESRSPRRRSALLRGYGRAHGSDRKLLCCHSSIVLRLIGACGHHAARDRRLARAASCSEPKRLQRERAIAEGEEIPSDIGNKDDDADSDQEERGGGQAVRPSTGT